jgi:hypothetical protein
VDREPDAVSDREPDVVDREPDVVDREPDREPDVVDREPDVVDREPDREPETVYEPEAVHAEPDATPDTGPETTPDTVPELTDVEPVAAPESEPDNAQESEFAPVPSPVADAPPVPEEHAGDLKPGDLDAAPLAALWGEGAAEQFRSRWQDAQLRFIDDPQHATSEAKAIVGEAIDALTESLANQRNELNAWEADASDGDTERLRVAVQRYRDFLDRLLGV